MQSNWIGKSIGQEIKFKIKKAENLKIKTDHIVVYTTRPDTLFGASFCALSTQHPLTLELSKKDKNLKKFIESNFKKQILKRKKWI